MTDSSSKHADQNTLDSVQAGMLSPWGVDDLPSAPPTGLRQWKIFLGPGVLLAGASVAAGEWLFGPAVSAQFGGTLLWLASISILCQVFLNLEVTRYAVYCGEPIFVGFVRSWPGPRFWTCFYLVMEIPNLWPFMASNAAVPLAAAVLGHLPGDATTSFLGIPILESQLVRALGYCIFLAAFIPLIFGGTVYRMLERVMTVKVVLVLGYLAIIALFMVSGRNALEVVTGFFRFGTVPFRAETIIAGPHFALTESEGQAVYTVRGTLEDGRPLVTSFLVNLDGDVRTYGMTETMPNDLQDPLKRIVRRAQALAAKDSFFVQHSVDDLVLSVKGRIAPDGSWESKRFRVEEADQIHSYERLEQISDPIASRFRALVTNNGLEHQNLFAYVLKHGGLPDLPWALLAAFFAIAGAGGMSNSLFSNYARDKGWGMGAKVGAIPSAVGGRSITLSHVGKVFRLSSKTRVRWREWMRYIRKDQLLVWMPACFLGMALPCMLSLEFIRNASVAGDRVAAMTAQGIIERYPAHDQLLWALTLLCGFLVLAPGQIFAGDSLARRWTDFIWVVSARARKLQGNQVKYVYYGILVVYGSWGLFALSLFDPLQIAKIGAGLGNVALGMCALHTLYVNRTLLPPELRPGWFRQFGLLCCGLIFLGISAIALPML